MRKGILLLLLALQLSDGLAGFDYSPNCRKAFQSVLQLRLDEARALLWKEQRQNPGNALVHLYSNYHDFLKAFITEEKRYADTLRINSERRQRLLDGEKDSPFKLFSKAEILIQSAMIKAKFSENFAAALDLHKAYRLAERNFVLYPTFPLNKKTLGLLHSLIGAVPKEYKWLVSVAGLEGTLEQGSDELFRMMQETARGIYPEYREEVLFYLVQIYSAISTNDSVTAQLADSVRKNAASSPLMMYCFTNLAYKSGKNEEALAVINTFEAPGIFPFYFLSFKKAQLRLRKLDMGAKMDFEKYVLNFRGLNYIKSAYQKLAWIALLNNDEKKYREYMAAVKKRGIALVDEDKDAMKESENREMPNPVLLRARLLFDGGYYKESFREMTKVVSPSRLPFRDQLEYTYRYGRLFHKTGNLEKAVMNYKATIHNGEKSTYYFAANAALMLGLLFEQEKDYGKSKYYFEYCLNMRHHDYQNSIDQKAQAGLERIRLLK